MKAIVAWIIYVNNVSMFGINIEPTEYKSYDECESARIEVLEKYKSEVGGHSQKAYRLSDTMRCKEAISLNQPSYQINEFIEPDRQNLVPSLPDIYRIGRYDKDHKFYVTNVHEFDTLEKCKEWRQGEMDNVEFGATKLKDIDDPAYGAEARKTYDAAYACYPRRPQRASDMSYAPFKPIKISKPIILVERNVGKDTFMYYGEFSSKNECIAGANEVLKKLYNGLRLFISNPNEQYNKTVAQDYHNLRMSEVEKRKANMSCASSVSVNPEKLIKSIEAK